MSKILHYAEEVEVPDNVDVKIQGMRVKVKGPKGELIKDFSHIRQVLLRKENKKIVVETYFANRKVKACIGTIASHIRNMITGVTKGYRYKLKIVYSHFPISVKVQGKRIIIENFLGEKAPRITKIYGDDVTVRVEGDDVIVEGIDIEHVGQTAANIERAARVKEYDPRVFMDGIYIYEKGVMEEE
ncbi:MAG: 50S ribosomal protein L6 [Desulfurococcales archaeon ex4484_217_1]|nr:MAG: 50S ribosomal protein L6 [Desulfurococcales archaeon ex4484_217_1]